MVHLAFIFHMHQPYYKNLLTQETPVPWVRLHGIKDYLDMVQILEKYPAIHQTFNLVPSLIEQICDYTNGTIKDRFLELSYKPAAQLSAEEKAFILDRFFMINKDTVIAVHPRYYELYFKKQAKREYTTQDYLDLQVWFNLAWYDPCFRENIPELKKITAKARFFSEEDKRIVLDKQIDILKATIPVYKQYMASGQIEVTLSPYFHPILPLLYNTNIAKEANNKTSLPQTRFSYPLDAKSQIDAGVMLYRNKFGADPTGMWPSEEAVSEHILPFIMQSPIRWIVADEEILFRSLGKKKRDTKLLYQPHLLSREDGELTIVFRDRNLSDLIGFTYPRWDAKSSVDNFMGHVKNIADAFKDRDILVTVALDGENAWEYFRNDGHDFLNLLYQRLSESTSFVKTVTVNEYLKKSPAQNQIRRLAAGSWIYAEFSKWIGNPYKNKAWDYLAKARNEFQELLNQGMVLDDAAWKQVYICEGSDWFWWYGDKNPDFDHLFRMHLSNLYTLMKKEIPEYLKYPLE